MMQDTRFVYGASCTWFGSIYEVDFVGPQRLPCCPFCQRMLFEMDTEAEWWKSVNEFEANGHPGYRAMLEWQRMQKCCFPASLGAIHLVIAYEKATGIKVQM